MITGSGQLRESRADTGYSSQASGVGPARTMHPDRASAHGIATRIG
jgi:hypothetical protein